MCRGMPWSAGRRLPGDEQPSAPHGRRDGRLQGSWPTRARPTSARASASPAGTAPPWPTTCASGTTAGRASGRWPPPPNRSYGFVHRLLSESGASLRSRGGANRNARRRDRPRAPTAGCGRRARAPLLTVTLDRADQLNAQTPATWAALARCGASLDDDVRVVVVRGRGPVVLRGAGLAACSAPTRRRPAGWASWGGCRRSWPRSGSAGYQAASAWLRSPGIVSVAAVQGHAIGAGAQLALACDLRVLDRGRPASGCRRRRSGLVPDLTGTSTLTELVATPGRWRSASPGARSRRPRRWPHGAGERGRPARGPGRPRWPSSWPPLTGPRRWARSARPRRWCAPPSATTPAAQDAAERAAQARRLAELAGG